MGNQLVGIAPSQIFPVEHYLTEHSELHFDINLGSTRFFKVARARSQEGLIVVKVFAIHDPSLPLAAHKTRVEQIRTSLASAVNCLPFQRAILSDKAGFLIREYVKYSLYDRISTRPFLSPIEKKWIAFQLLYALHQCHKVGVCHGDIKLENVTVTSWHWVLLTDFASFKPTHLPEDNPADFSYFFDTSRRRTCYIAPERFVKTLGAETNSQLLLTQEHLKKGDMTPAMDIFSAGCVLAELFLDGHPPFDFSQLLAYRCGEFSLEKYLSKIEDEQVKALVGAMVQRDPTQRLSAELYLSQERGKLFPEYFYTFLHSYVLIFSATSPILSPDEKIERLKKDVHNIINLLKSEEEKHYEAKDGDSKNSPQGCEALVLITSLVTSCIRGLHFSNSKLQCLEILLDLTSYTTAETVLDRILPYIMYFIHDQFPRVRVCALHTLTKALSYVKTVPLSDANVFPEYILPALASVAHDEAVIVRATFAENIAELAETSLRLLEHWQVSHGETPRNSYESELATLHEMMQQMVATLLTDPQNVVKQTLIENGITKLCVFFGKQKANDVLLSHMITFLNDKEDKQLRGSFFDCIVGVAAYIGVHSSPILLPLLQQGLTDCEEFVVRKAINAVTALTELSLLHKCALYQLLEESSCLLAHPNLWIRQAVVGFISALARTLNIVDVQCKVMVVIQPYLKHQVIQLEKEVLVLNALKSCVPRVVYDCIVRCSDLQLLIQTLIDRQRARLVQITPITLTTGLQQQSAQQNNDLRNLFCRLSSDGMTEDIEDQLILMVKLLHKVHRYNSTEKKHSSGGKVELSKLKLPVQCHSVTLTKTDHMKTDGNTLTVNRRSDDFNHLNYNMNEEWKHMFGGDIKTGIKLSVPSSWDNQPSSNQHSLEIDYSMQERSYIQYRCAPCRLELRELIQHRELLQGQLLRGQKWADKLMGQPVISPPGWRLRPSLVSHLHGHTAPITRLVTLPKASILASCSGDGCVRIWDCGKMEGRNIANRARQVYNTHSGPLLGMTLCNNNTCLALSSRLGSIIVLKIEANSNKMFPLDCRQLDLDEEGPPVDIAHFNSGSQSVLVYPTVYGYVIGWDLRAPGIAWKLENDLRQGGNKSKPARAKCACDGSWSLAVKSWSTIASIHARWQINQWRSRKLNAILRGGAGSMSCNTTAFGSAPLLKMAYCYNMFGAPNPQQEMTDHCVITAMHMDSKQCCLSLGTSSGFHTCWDLRFHLPIATIQHPSGVRVKRLSGHPTEPSWLISAAVGNDEVSLWDIESESRRTVLWGSSTPPLTHTQGNSHSVCALYSGIIDRTPFLLTGGTDHRVRYWDLDNLEGSYVAIPAGSDSSGQYTYSYNCRQIDGTHVVQEIQSRSQSGSGGGRRGPGSGEECPRAGPDQPATGHHNAITDITLCHGSQCFMVTGARDGVIKVWK